MSFKSSIGGHVFRHIVLALRYRVREERRLCAIMETPTVRLEVYCVCVCVCVCVCEGARLVDKLCLEYCRECCIFCLERRQWCV